MKVGGEPLQQEFNRGYDFILNTYGAAENIMPDKNTQMVLVKGIVIDIDFQIDKNYKLAEFQPPFSIYAKIIGEDLDVDNPNLEVQKLYYSPLLPIHNVSIPEIGEEILIMRESTNVSSRGYYIGRICNTSTLNYYPARKYMDSLNQGVTSPEFKYGFSFNVDELRRQREHETPTDEINSFSIPLTFGDVVQQGRSQTYTRHSFNRNNKKGVLEQGIRGSGQPTSSLLFSNVIDPSANGEIIIDPSIGITDTKNIHFIDKSVMRLGDFPLVSTLPDNLNQGDLDAESDKSMIVNIADEIYNISTKQTDTSMYRHVLGEKLIKHQAQTNSLIKTMLDGLTGLTETVQVLLEAFVEHEHALPKIDLKLEKEIETKDTRREPPRVTARGDKRIFVPGSMVRIKTGSKTVTRPKRGFENMTPMPNSTEEVEIPIYNSTFVPGKWIRVPQPPRITPGRIRQETITQNINFEHVIGGEEDPRFTMPVRLVSNPEPVQVGTRRETWGEYYKRAQMDRDQIKRFWFPGDRTYRRLQLRNLPRRTDIPVYGDPPPASPSSLGVKTNKVNTESQNLIALFDAQKDRLNGIFTRATEFLSKNQFVN